MKRALIICTAALTVLYSLFCPRTNTAAYEAPQDIRLSIETKSVDINDIPEDRMISVEISTENCPPYFMLSFLLKKDSRTRYAAMSYLTCTEGIDGLFGPSYTLGGGEDPDFVMCTIHAVQDSTIDYNGVIASVNIIIPEDAKAGDFYSVEFLRHFSSVREYENSIALSNDRSSLFGDECFLELVSGGILITEDESEALVEPSVDRREDDRQDEAEESDEHQGEDDEQVQNEENDQGGNSNDGQDGPAVTTTVSAEKEAEGTSTSTAKPATAEHEITEQIVTTTEAARETALEEAPEENEDPGEDVYEEHHGSPVKTAAVTGGLAGLSALIVTRFQRRKMK